jgi:phosphohistidine phosphatase
MELYLVRHAIAERRDPTRWPDDAERPLTREGANRFRAAARGVRTLGISVDAVLASSYVRASSTAEILEAEASWPASVRWRELEPEVDPAACLDSLRGRSESALALVGHQPQLGRLASLLLAGDADRLDLEVKKGAVICVASDDLLPGASRLRWSASPRMLRLVGGR